MPEQPWFSTLEALKTMMVNPDGITTPLDGICSWWDQYERGWGCDPRIQVTNEKPHVTFERLENDEFRVVTNCVELTADVFAIPVGAALTIDIPNRPPLYLNEMMFGD